jgi:hypothetical protein
MAVNKVLDMTYVLVDFEGDELNDQDGPLTLKKSLLMYLVNANRIGTVTDSPTDAILAYEAGVKIGCAPVKVVLSEQHIDVLKKLVQCNKLNVGGRQEPMYGLVVTQQLLNILARATVVETEA